MEKESRETNTDHVRKNLYLCGICGCGWVSVNLDKGVTPFMDKCVHCGAMAESLMFLAPQPLLAKFPAKIGWYKPDEEEIKASSSAMREHARKGGLFRRVLIP